MQFHRIATSVRLACGVFRVCSISGVAGSQLKTCHRVISYMVSPTNLPQSDHGVLRLSHFACVLAARHIRDCLYTSTLMGKLKLSDGERFMLLDGDR